MGCDIHSFVEIRLNDQWVVPEKGIFPCSDWEKEYYKTDFKTAPFDWRSYGMFGFLADVRNYSKVPCIIAGGSRGMPADASSKAREECEDWGLDGHSHSYIMLKELTDYDYDVLFEDRRTTKEVAKNVFNCAALADEGDGNSGHRNYEGIGFAR